MPHLTKCQKQSRKVCKIKATNKSTQIDFYDESDSYDNDDNIVIHNELEKNDNAASIIRKLQEAAKKYYQEYAFYKACRLHYIGNSKHIKRWKN